MKKHLKKQLVWLPLVMLLLVGIVVFGLIPARALDGLFGAISDTGLPDSSLPMGEERLEITGEAFEDTYLDDESEPYNVPLLLTGAAPSISNQQAINAIAGKRYDITVAANGITDFTGMIITVQYDHTVMQLTDLCSLTKEKELSSGTIPSIGVTFTQVTPGTLVFTVAKTIPSGKEWSGAINTISLKALQTVATTVSVTSNSTKVATPTASPLPGTYSAPQSVTLNCATLGATIRYTTDGTEPTGSSTAYNNSPISLSVGNTTIKAKAFLAGMTDSETAGFAYTVQLRVAAPTASPLPGTYISSTTVALSCATLGATIRYTINGTEPTSISTLYTTPISVNETTTVKAKAFKSGLMDSDTAPFTYIIQVATPTASPLPGTYSAPQNVALNCATLGATIRYTTNGAEPTSSSTLYTTPIPVNATTTIKAKAFKTNLTDSATASFAYTVSQSGGLYTLEFFEEIWGGGGYEYNLTDYFIIDVNSTDTVNMYAFVLDGQGNIVDGQEVASIVFASDSGVQNTTGVFTLDDLEIGAWGEYPDTFTNVTATATLSDSTVLQAQALVEAIAIAPKKTPGNKKE